jgi:hypothetical protein
MRTIAGAMHPPPIFIPEVYWNEMKKLPKSTLMDMVWNLAQRCAGVGDDRPRQIMEEVIRTADIVTIERWRRRQAP